MSEPRGMVSPVSGTRPERLSGEAEKMERLFVYFSGGTGKRCLQVDCAGMGPLPGVAHCLSLAGVSAFRHRPEFELIAVTCPEKDNSCDGLLAALQYCRLLLRPGAMLGLLLPRELPASWYHGLLPLFPIGRSWGRACPRMALLARAGYMDIRKQAWPGCGRIISGRRPWQRW